jgi:hypothetical protein
MKLPNQAAPVQRSAGTARIVPGIAPSGPCESRCNTLPEPARSICRASCAMRVA